jgi:hypothetical protein
LLFRSTIQSRGAAAKHRLIAAAVGFYFRPLRYMVSDAFRLMIKIAKGKALPFEPLVPNKETIEAMKAARRTDHGRPARGAAHEPECGLLNKPAASGATTAHGHASGAELTLHAEATPPRDCFAALAMTCQ